MATMTKPTQGQRPTPHAENKHECKSDELNTLHKGACHASEENQTCGQADPKFERVMAAYKKVSAKYRNTLLELAK